MSEAAAMATCGHKSFVHHKFINGEMWVRCVSCGKTWKKPVFKPMPTLILAGNHDEYLKFLKDRSINPYNLNGMYAEGGSAGVVGRHFDRLVIAGTFRQRENAGTILALSRAALNPGGKISYADIPEGWYNGSWDVNGDPVLHDEDGGLRCNWCRVKCSETYRGGFCSGCHNEGKKHGVIQSMATKKYGPGSKQWDMLQPKHALPMSPGMSAAQIDLVKTINKTIRKEGDIWKLPKANSPMWTEQWGYQGSAKLPYIISKRDEDHADGSTTKDGWACACPNFTRHTPRTPCKHILNVIVKEGLGTVKPAAAKLASVDDKKLKEFEEWQRQQAALKKDNVPTSGAKLNLFGATTRKFR